MQRGFGRESLSDGIEFTCGLYKVGDKKVVMPVAEVVSKKEFFDYEAKYDAKCRMRLFPDVFCRDYRPDSGYGFRGI